MLILFLSLSSNHSSDRLLSHYFLSRSFCLFVGLLSVIHLLIFLNILPGMQRHDWLSSITWDAVTRTQLVNLSSVYGCKHWKRCACKKYPVKIIYRNNKWIIGPGPYRIASGSGPGPRSASYRPLPKVTGRCRPLLRCPL